MFLPATQASYPLVLRSHENTHTRSRVLTPRSEVGPLLRKPGFPGDTQFSHPGPRSSIPMVITLTLKPISVCFSL